MDVPIEVENSQLEALVNRLINEFRLKYPEFGTPEGASSMCRYASALFVTCLRQHGVWAWVDEIDVVNDISHRAACLQVHRRTMWVDWTARQFNPDADFPVIEYDFPSATP